MTGDGCLIYHGFPALSSRNFNFFQTFFEVHQPRSAPAARDRLLIYTLKSGLSSQLLNFFQSFSISRRPFRGGFELPLSKRFSNIYPFRRKCKAGFQKNYVFFEKRPRGRGRVLRPAFAEKPHSGEKNEPQQAYEYYEYCEYCGGGGFNQCSIRGLRKSALRPQTGWRPGGLHVGTDSTRQMPRGSIPIIRSIHSIPSKPRSSGPPGKCPVSPRSGGGPSHGADGHQKIKSTILAGGSTAKPHGPTESGVPEKCPVSPRSGGGTALGADGHFLVNQKYHTRRREYGEAARTDGERGPRKMPLQPAERGRHRSRCRRAFFGAICPWPSCRLPPWRRGRRKS